MGLVRAKPIGRTSFLDAIHLSLLEMRHAHNLRKAILILSDGIDNHSRYTEVRDQGIGARERPDLRHRHIRSERLVCRIHLEIGHRYRPTHSVIFRQSIS